MRHIIETWKKHGRLQLATMIVLVASFCVISGVMTVTYNFSNILTLWGESLQISAYLSENTSNENISSIEKYLKENTKIDKLKFVKKEEALSEFREQMASYAPDVINDNDLLRFIPASFRFSINKNVAIKDQLNVMKDVAVALKVLPGVDEVSYGQDWIKSYTSITTALQWIGAVFMVVIFLSAGFVMSNSIHTSISQRRSEIEVLELIGATAKTIRKPFLYEGAFLGGASCALAILLCFGLYTSIRTELNDQVAFLQLSNHLKFLNLNMISALMVFSVVLGALASWLCVRRINTGWAASSKQKEAHT